jgi:hypothetical protein
MQSPDVARHFSRLSRIARRATCRASAAEPCELCAQPVHAEHRHLLDLHARRLLCVCQACAVLFDRSEGGGRHYRLVPDQCRLIGDFTLPDALWERIAIPVDLAFMFRNTSVGRVVAFYPGPAGATESLLELGTWEEIASANPVLRTMEPDVEALLVNRARGAREYWLVPVDECYRLVGLMRTHWRGLSGGEEVWREITGFFEALRRRSMHVYRDGKRAAPAGAATERVLEAPSGGGGHGEANQHAR